MQQSKPHTSNTWTTELLLLAGSATHSHLAPPLLHSFDDVCCTQPALKLFDHPVQQPLINVMLASVKHKAYRPLVTPLNQLHLIQTEHVEFVRGRGTRRSRLMLAAASLRDGHAAWALLGGHPHEPRALIDNVAVICFIIKDSGD